MVIEPSESLYCVAQPFAWKGVLHQSLTVGLGFDLCTRRMIPAAEVMGVAMQALLPGECLDMGLPKREAEWLLAGNAQTPHGKPMTSLVARVQVGASRRRFLLTGEADASGTPQAFTKAPLAWKETFGAPDHPENPLGCGLAPEPGTGRVRAPRLVDADAAHGRPASPGPMGAWPARMRNMGSYDAHWQKTCCPDLPDDCNLSYINLAQPAQRLPELRGDEALTLAGFHHAHPEIETRLPGKTVTVHVRRGKDAAEQAIVAPWDTLWLFPNRLSGLMLAHLLLPCADSLATDIATIRLEVSPPDPIEAPAAAPKIPPPAAVAPPPVPEIPPPVAAVPPKAAEATAAVAAVAEKAATSAATIAAAIPTNADAKTDAPASAQPASAAATPPPTVLAPADAPSSFADTIGQMRARALAELDTSLPEINAALAQAGLPPLTPEQEAETRAQIIAQADTMHKLVAEIEAKPPPELHDVLRQAGVSEEMIQGVDAVMEMSPPNPADYQDAVSWNAAIEAYLADFERHLPLSDSVRETQRTTLRLQGPGGEELLEQMAGPTPTLEEALTRAGIAPDKAVWLARELDKTPDFASMEEMKTYLAGMEKTMGFNPGSMVSVVENVEKVAAQVGIPLPLATAASGETVEAQTLAQAAQVAQVAQAAQTGKSPEKIVEGLAAGAALSAAGKAALDAVQGAVGTPPLSPPSPAAAAAAAAPAPAAAAPAGGEAVSYAWQNLAGRDFSGQKLDGVDFTHSQLMNANFSGASLQNANFDHADCTGANFTQATLDRASFQNTCCAEALFSGASATSAHFLQTDLRAAQADGLRADRAEWTGATLPGASLRGASFQGALLKGLQAAGVNAEGANLSDTNCVDCDFSGGHFQKANWQAALLSGARLAEADLRAANLAQATLMGGTLANANLGGANLTESDWRTVDARQSRFDACNAQGARFAACQLEGSRWNLSRALEANFSQSGLAGADFSRANLMRASLRESQVAGTDFSAANLYGADLYRADMERATVRDALLENTLLFAQGKAG